MKQVAVTLFILYLILSATGCSDTGNLSPNEPPPASGGQNLKLSQAGRFNGEPTIAVNPANPDNLISSWMHSAGPSRLEIQVAFSEDRGASWSEPVSFGHIDAIYETSADVSVVFDWNGTAHLTYIEVQPDLAGSVDCEFQIQSAEVLHRSSVDGGATWSDPVRVVHSTDTTDFSIDRPWLAVDRSRGSRDGTVYVVTISFYCNNPAPQHIHVRRSTDQGATWSAAVQVDNTEFGTGPFPDLPFPAVLGIGGDGALWIVYPSVGSTACGGGASVCLLAAMSIDGGQTFTRSKVADVTPAGDRGFPLWHTLAADMTRPGRAGVFWPDGGLDPSGSELLFAQTKDGGQTWSIPVRINDNPPGLGIGVGQPWAAAGADGTLAVVWRDRRAAGAGAQVPFEAYMAVSLDGGDTFLSNQKLSDQPSPFNEVPCCNSFLGLTVDDGWVHANWGDFREGRWEIFYVRKRAIP